MGGDLTRPTEAGSHLPLGLTGAGQDRTELQLKGATESPSNKRG